MSFLENLSAEYLEQQYRLWQRDPAALGADWQAFFHRITSYNVRYPKLLRVPGAAGRCCRSPPNKGAR